MLPCPQGAQPPVPDFRFSPEQPSVFDTIQLSDGSHDPEAVGIASATWDLGDGATAVGSSPVHRYRADGEYRVRLTVITVDGRIASITRIVSVRTRDVAIVSLETPRSAAAGRTCSISVWVVSLRSPETVQVEIFHNGDVQPIDRLIKPVAARKRCRFDFAYTFGELDAAAGEVTFKAVATIVGARDARPADNAAVAAATVIRPARDTG
jgi:hypothetical protein